MAAEGKDSLGRFTKGHKFGYRFQKGQVSPNKGRRYKCKSYNLTEVGKLQKIKNLGVGMLGHRQTDYQKQKMKEIHTGKTIIHSEETRKKLRYSMINHIKEFRGEFKSNIGKYETQYLDFLEDDIGLSIVRQYPVCGYFLDGYCKERNVAFEIDERPKVSERDIRRESEIKNELNCGFIRIPLWNK